MIVCDVCKQKAIATEIEIHFKASMPPLNPPFPIKMHLCSGHQAQLIEAIKLVASIFRSVDEMPNDDRMREWIDRIIPWVFDDKGNKISRTS